MTLPRRAPVGGGFTLVELLVSMAILVVLLLMLVSVTESTQRSWTYTTASIQQFRDAREAFESMTRRLSQATLNTYWDYDNANAPTRYIRQSELRFIAGNASALTGSTNIPTHAVFFQAPMGYVVSGSFPNLNRLLNTWGYFVEFVDDSQVRPAFLTNQIVPLRSRFRLMELMEPSDNLSLYKYTSGLDSGTPPKPSNQSYVGHQWFGDPLASPSQPIRAMAENIVALILLPKLSLGDEAAGGYTDTSLAPKYSYDSTDTTQSDPNLDPKNQLPPVIQVTIVAVDEISYKRYQQGLTRPSPDPLFNNAPFSDATQYAVDLANLQQNLQNNKLSFRVFSTNVNIGSAKWSRAQKN
jgi:uncharacterized protein (TIGR02599 family)